MLDDVADMGAARGDAGHRRDMIGLERMLHAEQKSQPQNSEHAAEAARDRWAQKGPEPTRYGDWEVGGRCTNF